ncbi:MAG TPA: pyridoxal-5'-phosphate-dependent protein subunit beta, partial [Acidimicrobiales bacterium]|nr:pyridoxal-5'-phosphate-dependent protein subunit beta [Acidimicrobiales bacterium]
IKLAKRLGLGPHDVVMTVATDSADLYDGERADRLAGLDGSFDEAAARRAFGEHLLDVTDDHVLMLSDTDRDRIFNLGYFTWVEQQDVSLSEFEQRRDQQFWRGLRELLPVWDDMIIEFNGRTGVLSAR